MNISCIDLYNELTNRLQLLSLDNLNYLFNDTKMLFDNKIYKWDCHERQPDINRYYLYEYTHNIDPPIIWYPYSKSIAIRIFIQATHFSLIGIEHKPLSVIKVKSLLEYFKIEDKTTWEERLEYILYQFI